MLLNCEFISITVRKGFEMSKVNVEVKKLILPTYKVHKPEKNPFFLEKRVFQGSSGKTYPLPFYNRVSEEKVEQEWEAICIENDYIEVVILPEIGGRIFSARDKSNGYDFIYRQDVIKPALVGLAGPWISGGIEFNWPQHHRPATYMPTGYEIEYHADGAITIWLSDHDPLQHMKGMHGVCLYPDRSYIELKVRAYNRTENVQTFLWWANIATRVHEQYQSFFPADVSMVADHAKRALSTFPHCSDKYYGVDYRQRAENGVPEGEKPAKFVPPHCRNIKEGEVDYKPNDLSWYANIPVPTSYMCIGSEGDFCGGYDHRAQAGTVHVANHHISPGKKQWTWGNHDFGYAWDRNLSDSEEPYIEIMAGVYTDNQPDFSFLLPGETKTWSQYFYPLNKIGILQQATKDFALSLRWVDTGVVIGVAATAAHDQVQVKLEVAGSTLFDESVAVSPSQPFMQTLLVPVTLNMDEVKLVVRSEDGTLVSYTPVKREVAVAPETASEPPAPADIYSTDELYITGLHLEQYRHATRLPELYWQEALKRDSGDARCNNAMGLKCLSRGQFSQAEEYFNTALKRLTRRNPNPADGEAYYNLGLTLRFQGRLKEAYDALYKATWNMQWRAPAFHALAELDCVSREWTQALEHVGYSLRYNTDNLRLLNLKAMILGKLGFESEARAVLNGVAALDKLDIWSRYLLGKECLADSQARVDLALDLERSGFYAEALDILRTTTPEEVSGTGPILLYLAAWIEEKCGNTPESARLREEAECCDPSYCFPSRLEEILALEATLKHNPQAGRAAYYLGNLLYNNRRHAEALQLWQEAVKHDPENAVAWRNIGIGAYNINSDHELALAAFAKAIEINPADARLLYERDLLCKRLGMAPEERFATLDKYKEEISASDELLIEYCTLLNQLGRYEETAEILYAHKFQPWEGGEGMALGLHVRLNLLRGQQALAAGEPQAACSYLELALTSPGNLGEAKHLLANQSDIHYWLGVAAAEVGDTDKARRHWKIAAQTKGDFQTMEVREFSEMTYYSAISLRRLGEKVKAEQLLEELKAYAQELLGEEAKIDYFATSLPNLLLFEEDLAESQQRRARMLLAQAECGLGNKEEARRICDEIIAKDPSHALAADFLKLVEQNSTPV